jgi:hypothetical protein
MRPRLVLFGASITEQSFASGGWGAALADHFARQVRQHSSHSPFAPPLALAVAAVCRRDIGFSLIRRMWCCAGLADTTRGGR